MSIVKSAFSCCFHLNKSVSFHIFKFILMNEKEKFIPIKNISVPHVSKLNDTSLIIYKVIDSFINVISLVLLICVLELICSHSCYCLYQQFNTCSSPRTMSVFRFLIDCLRSFGIEPTIST